MTVRAESDGKNFELPPYLHIEKDITEDEAYFTYKIADKSHEFHK